MKISEKNEGKIKATYDPTIQRKESSKLNTKKNHHPPYWIMPLPVEIL